MTLNNCTVGPTFDIVLYWLMEYPTYNIIGPKIVKHDHLNYNSYYSLFLEVPILHVCISSSVDLTSTFQNES